MYFRKHMPILRSWSKSIIRLVQKIDEATFDKLYKPKRKLYLKLKMSIPNNKKIFSFAKIF